MLGNLHPSVQMAVIKQIPVRPNPSVPVPDPDSDSELQELQDSDLPIEGFRSGTR